MLDGVKYFTCTCGSPGHTLRFVLDYDEDHGDYPQMPTIYTEIKMDHYLWWYERIWVAIKYVFGMDTPDHFGCWEIKPEDTDEIIEMFVNFRNADKSLEYKYEYITVDAPDADLLDIVKQSKFAVTEDIQEKPRKRAEWIPDKK